ncbi:MAG: metal ABC transporter substrate-binding protein, partial [Treponema sp.]|nr:metal ABC transporter substrate-binding protein [Treponema sp.]
MKKIFSFAAVLIFLGVFMSCEKKPESNQTLGVVTTIFAPYDFVRAIAGDRVQLTMLLKPGAESHSYEPAPQDIIAIRNSDVFIYVGGESDEWVEQILESIEPDEAGMEIITLMDCVDVVEEEIVEGMEEEEEEEE